MSTTHHDTTVLTVSDRERPVAVRDTLSGAISRAVIGENGILRERYGGSTYPVEDYEVLSESQSKPVIITQMSHSNCWHTSLCKNILDISVKRRKIVTREEALEFYGMDHECGWCQKETDVSIDELEAIAAGEYNGSNQDR